MLSELGRREDALPAAQEAADLHRELARGLPRPRPMRFNRYLPVLILTVSADGSKYNVEIPGQRKHARLPSCAYQRHSLRMLHGGSVATTSNILDTILDASWHL